METNSEHRELNENLGSWDRDRLHLLMEERLENILMSMAEKKKKRKRPAIVQRLPANQEKAEWNISEIPILFGA